MERENEVNRIRKEVENLKNTSTKRNWKLNTDLDNTFEFPQLKQKPSNGSGYH